MSDVALTRMSSKGQVVVPKALRERLGLEEGDVFAMSGKGDTIVLKRIETPSEDEFEELLRWGQEQARKKGFTRKDLKNAIADHCKANETGNRKSGNQK